MEDSGSSSGVKKKASSKMLKEGLKYREELEKRGVIYLSRVPPGMKPNKFRELLTPYGEITRLYLAVEDESARKRRAKSGGNGSKQFVEGWVEFSDKKVARSVAESLNNTRIGSKKGDYYYDDLWNLKYLKGFKWEFLTEKFAYERRVRETKLRAAMVTSKTQNAAFVEQVEKNKAHKHAQERRRARDGDDVDGDGGESKAKKKREAGGDEPAPAALAKRQFRQARVIASQHGGADAKADSKLLANIF
jgi:ESF2/ABP1 family protein